MNREGRRRFLTRAMATGLGLSVLGSARARWSRAAGAEQDGESREGILGEVILPKRVFLEGEPIPFGLKVTNQTRETITYWSAGWANKRLEVRDSRGEDAPLTELGQRARRAYDPDGSRRKNVPIELEPGESLIWGKPHPGPGETVRGLDAYFVLKPGAYTVRMVYEEPSEPTPFWFVTDDVAFEIVASENATEASAQRGAK